MKAGIVTLVLSGLLAVNQAVIAQSVLGARPCGQWIKEKPVGGEKSWTRITQESWLVGFLSGFAVGAKKNLLEGADADSLFVWTDNYCQANPLDRLDHAGSNLARELMQRKGL